MTKEGKGRTKEVNTLRRTIGNNLGRERSDGMCLAPAWEAHAECWADDSHNSIGTRVFLTFGGVFLGVGNRKTQTGVQTNGISERGATAPGAGGSPEEN